MSVTAGPIVYVVAEFPKLSQTFVLGEVRGLIEQGEDVRVLTLRPGPRDQAAPDLTARIVAAPVGVRGLVALAAAAVVLLVSAPERAVPELARVLRWTVRHHSLHELVRFGQAAYLIERLPPGARHLHAHFAHGAASVAMLLSRLTGIPFSFTAHARDLFAHTAAPVLREKVAAASFAVTISDHGRDFLTAVAPDHAHKIALVRNGIDLPAFARSSGVPPALDRPFEVLTVCRLVEKKGVDTLVDACAVLAERGTAIRCVVIGDGPLRAALELRATELGVAELVEFRGACDAAAVAAALHRAAAFVLPCRVDAAGDQDGLPVSIVEALAAGVPVVSTPVAGVPEAVVDGRSGLLVPPDEPGALADALARLAGDRELRRRLGDGAVQVAAEFDRARWVTVLRSLIDGGDPRRDAASSADAAMPAPSRTGREAFRAAR